MAKNHSKPKNEIALAIPLGVPHLGRAVQGIREYAKLRADWRFLISPETHHLPPASLAGWKGQGVIALCNTKKDEAVLKNLDCPVINISGALSSSAFPRVRNDYRGIGALGASFLRDRGFRRVGFYGVEGLWYSGEIEQGFCEWTSERGVSASVLRGQSTIEGVMHWNDGQEELENWLLSMKPPFAVMAAHDPRGAMVIRACERVGLKVPSDVAVIGVNDDASTCETCRPELTSIERNGLAVGFKAAEQLDALLKGKSIPWETILSQGEVRERESTHALGIDHPALIAAVRFIEARYRKAITVEQMADASGKSRRWLEEAFRVGLNCSPSEFLERKRIEVVLKRMEARPALSVGALASEAGFSGTRQLNAAFSRRFNRTFKQFQLSVVSAKFFP